MTADSDYLNLPLRTREAAAIDVARNALHRILIRDGDPQRTAEKALLDMATLLDDGDEP